ncbi:hypothetical protein F4859DRAFT_516214 [Xylaria cf. heliscus]|nr:hypothetical protein F4859DRAFT_516214 [Xylaria cf. heliscus]
MPDLMPGHLYVALQYPTDPLHHHEHSLELLPKHLQKQDNRARELEYAWSFILTSARNAEMLTAQYVLVSPPLTGSSLGGLNVCIRNECRPKHSRYIEIFDRAPGLLGNIPRLMILLEIGPVNVEYFEVFLANHLAVATWPLFISADHAAHLWVRDVLVGYPGFDINDETIISVEEAVRTSLRRHLCQRKPDHDWTDFTRTPMWRVHIYDVNCHAYCRDKRVDEDEE